MRASRSKNRRKSDGGAKHAPARTSRGRWLGVSLLMAVVAGGAVAGWHWATRSPVFALRTLRVHGLARAPEHEVMRLSGLSAGQNILTLDLGAIERNIASHPFIAKAKVQRHFPSGISVEVVERQPVAMALIGDLYLVDGEGTPFKRIQATDSVDMPLVTGLGRDQCVAKPDACAERIRSALELGRTYLKSAVGRRLPLSEIRIETEDDLSLLLGEGLEVKMGHGDFEAKFSRLSRVMAELDRQKLEARVVQLDDRARASRVAVRLASGANAVNDVQ